MTEVKATLHELFETQAIPARLAALGRQVGLPPRPVPGRRVAVLAGVRDAASAAQLAGQVLGQRLRPHEVVVWLEGELAAASPQNTAGPQNTPAETAARDQIGAVLGPLSAAGIITGVVSGACLAAAARAAVSPWAAEWDPQLAYPPLALLELMCALECSRADAVGYAPGLDYVFTDAVDPAVARTGLLREGAPPRSTWARRGLRLFAIAPAGQPAEQAARQAPEAATAAPTGPVAGQPAA
jgi:hypothetical protein